MINTSPRALLVATLVLGGATVSASSSEVDADHGNDALSQIAELKKVVANQSREIAAMKQEDGESWLTEQRAGEIRGIVQDVLADADSRTSFQDSGAMAGWNKGFFLASPDGNFKLKISGQVQVRYILNHLIPERAEGIRLSAVWKRGDSGLLAAQESGWSVGDKDERMLLTLTEEKPIASAASSMTSQK